MRWPTAALVIALKVLNRRGEVNGFVRHFMDTLIERG